MDYSPCNSQGQNTRVGSLTLLQGIFPTQGSNPGLPRCRQILYQLNHEGSPRILEWIAYPFSIRSSQLRNRTRVSCIAGGFFTNWAIREALTKHGCEGAVLRWQRNRTGRQLSPPWIHQKNFWTLSKFHKTTSECWQRTSGTQKSSPLSSKGDGEVLRIL